MRYGLNLFQFLFNIMAIMCLVQESMEMPNLGCLKLTTRILAVAVKGIGT